MQGILQMEKVWKAIIEKWDPQITEEMKEEIKQTAYNLIMFKLTDDVARQVMREMSLYENVIGGKLKLKGKPLDVKTGGTKKKKKHKKHISQNYELIKNDLSEGQAVEPSSEEVLEDNNKLNGEGNSHDIDDHLTPAERRYLEQKEKIDAHRLAKTANKSHRDRIEDFNQYLANMSEHYDIPKVGPG